jgi:FkbM family methyltransferase
MIFVSYAQNFEDVLLARAFPSAHGFYIDVGANDPDIDSVSRAFYERGWSGINIEPLPQQHARLVARRPRDVNLRIAVGENDGETVFYAVDEWHGFSTTDPQIVAQHRADKLRVEEQRVPLRRLAAVIDEHGGGRPIDFMKIDVEGSELAVLRGAELERHRPKILVVEARLPVTFAMVERPDEVPDRSEEYAAFLAPLRYSLVYHDGLNAFFVADEHRELARHFARPAGSLDRFVHAASIRLYEARIAELGVLVGGRGRGKAARAKARGNKRRGRRGPSRAARRRRRRR